MSLSLNSGSRLPHGIILLNMGHNKFWAVKFLNMEQPKIHSKSNVTKPVFLAADSCCIMQFPCSLCSDYSICRFCTAPIWCQSNNTNKHWLKPFASYQRPACYKFPCLLYIPSLIESGWNTENFYYFPTIIPQHVKSNESVYLWILSC